MEELVLIVLGVVAVWCALVAGAVALVIVLVRRVAAALRGTARSGAREIADRTRLRVGAYGVGAQAEAAKLRLELRAAVTDTRRTMTAAAEAGWPVGDAPSLVRRLEQAAAGLDTQLRLIALDRRPAGSGADEAGLPEVRERVGTVVTACVDLRSSVRRQAARVDDDELHRLREDCRIESEALAKATEPPGQLTQVTQVTGRRPPEGAARPR